MISASGFCAPVMWHRGPRAVQRSLETNRGDNDKDPVASEEV